MITISCLCGTARQTLALRSPDTGTWPKITLCHCDSCRHLTGLLCTSYVQIASAPLLTGLVSYSPSPSSSRYFCSTCGCHVFRSTRTAEQCLEWEVATGVISTTPDLPSPESPGAWQHNHTDDTNDGGLSIYLSDSTSIHHDAPNPVPSPWATLPASCFCGRISLTITRPSRDSTLPHSNYADLLLAYCNTPPSVVSNPSSVKWWLRDPSPSAHPPSRDARHHPAADVLEPASEEALARYKYLAGTCACRSCRLTSGFEIQTWAFIPRSNIFVNVPPSIPGVTSTSDKPMPAVTSEPNTIPLDFSSLPAGLLNSYHSSHATVREFCPACGATVFWHDAYRPDLIDVSVGLLRCPSGRSRAESFLSWWAGRVSFSEETKTERAGWIATWAQSLVTDLENGLRRSSH